MILKAKKSHHSHSALAEAKSRKAHCPRFASNVFAASSFLKKSFSWQFFF